MPTRVGIRREFTGQLQWSVPLILDVGCAISPQRQRARASGRDAQSAHAQAILQIAKMRVRVRWTENSKKTNLVNFNEKNGTRRLMRGIGSSGMRCCVHARATRPRTQNHLERLYVKSPRTSPRAYVIVMLCYWFHIVEWGFHQRDTCTVRLREFTMTDSPQTPRNLPTDLEVSGKSWILPDTLPIVPSGW